MAFRTVLAFGALATVSAGASVAVAASTDGIRQTEVVTLRHESTGFSVQAPRGFRLAFGGAAYLISGTGIAATARFVRTSKGARAFGEKLRPRTATVVLRRGNARSFRMLSDVGGRRTNLLVVRRGTDLVVTSATYAKGRADLARVANGIGASVRRSTPSGTSPAPSGARLLPLSPYRAPDGGATAWVPSDADWTISSRAGALEGSSPRGSFLFGQTFSIFLPGAAPPGSLPAGNVTYPFVNAADALTQVWPLINQSVGVNMSNARVRQLLADATLPSFRSSGMLVYDFAINGRAYVGVANIATEDRLSTTSNFFWQMYISGIAVPADGDPTVGAALRLVWRSWNPSGAIAARNEQARQILTEINETWKGVAEFRSRTADRQSRDVSCLLRTGGFVDDNARQLGLPPLLDCDSTYVPRVTTS